MESINSLEAGSNYPISWFDILGAVVIVLFITFTAFAGIYMVSTSLNKSDQKNAEHKKDSNADNEKEKDNGN